LKAIAALRAAETISISSITLFEIGQKVRLGKWPEMVPNVAALADMALRQGVEIIDVTPEVGLSAGVMHWDHRDPFDRIIGATAQSFGLQLLSADAAFDDLKRLYGWPGRIW
jgi:PIN domain nuclease of toxin-antitoxin system